METTSPAPNSHETCMVLIERTPEGTRRVEITYPLIDLTAEQMVNSLVTPALLAFGYAEESVKEALTR